MRLKSLLNALIVMALTAGLAPMAGAQPGRFSPGRHRSHLKLFH